MIVPPYLQPGDTIGITATARKISREELAPAIAVFESWGYKVKLSPTLFEAYRQFAGTDEQRVTGFNALLADEEVKAIVCARGGYGSVRIVDTIDWELLRSQPKWIVGYSDVTVLHTHIQRHLGIVTLHATMPLNMNAEPERQQAISSLKEALEGKYLQYTLPGHALNKPRDAKGIFTGGNLSVIYSLLGSVSFPETEGKIFFLEDLDEYLYHIDRMMVGLKRAGALSNLAALVVGGMTEMRDNAIPFGKTAEEIIYDIVKDYHYPVYFGLEAGHIANNQALPMGMRAQITNNILLFDK